MKTHTWRDRLRNVYNGDIEQFRAYDDIYGIAARLGYSSAEEAWRDNPMVGGSVNPVDFGLASDSDSAFVACKFCGKQVPEKTAHRHEDGWVGDGCCWDERLRSSE